jgi:glycosyltransferase involved in cell wall biosynthesis
MVENNTKSKTNKKIKIVVICEYFPPHVGGAEKLFYLHVKNLVKNKNFEFRVVTSFVDKAKTYEPLADNCFIYRYKWFNLFSHPIANVNDLKHHVDWADIVHTATYSCAIQSLILAKLKKKKCLLTVYEILEKRWLTIASNLFSGFIFYLFEKLLLALPFDSFHAISNHTHKKMLRYVPKSKSLMIYPFVENVIKAEINIKRQNYFLFFGRAGKTKGLDLLIDSIIELNKRNMIFPFVLIIGKHPKGEREKIINKIKKHQLANVLVLNSQPKDKLKIYIQLAKAVIVPSLTEGFGYSAHEASQLVTPVIYSSDTSLNEVVSLGKPFKVKDSVSLAYLIEKSKSTKWDSKKSNICNKNSLNQWYKLYDAIEN